MIFDEFNELYKGIISNDNLIKGKSIINISKFIINNNQKINDENISKLIDILIDSL